MQSQCYLPPNTGECTHLHSIQVGWYSIYLVCKDGWLSWPRWWLVSYWDRQSPIQATTNLARCRATLLIRHSPLPLC